MTTRDSNPLPHADGQDAAPKILVVGTGAIGGFYGAKLSQAGAHVAVVCRSDFERVRDQGIDIQSIGGNFKFVPEQVVRHPEEYQGVPDFVLVAVKVLPEVKAVDLVRPVMGPHTAIVLIQNGLFIEKPFLEAFPSHEIISCLAFIAVRRTGPGQVTHQDYGRLALGNYPEGASSKVALLSQWFQKSGIECQVVSQVERSRWQKLVWNAAFNPVSVLGGALDTESMLGQSELRELLIRAMGEVLGLAEVGGHEFPQSMIQQNLDATLSMKPFKTSMLVDFEAGRPMEVEAILGNAVRFAKEKSVPVPVLESLYALILSVDRVGRKNQA